MTMTMTMKMVISQQGIGGGDDDDDDGGGGGGGGGGGVLYVIPALRSGFT